MMLTLLVRLVRWLFHRRKGQDFVSESWIRQNVYDKEGDKV